MYVINVPFVEVKEDETCVLVTPNTSRFPPIPDMVNEVWKVMNLMPEVKLRITLKLKAEMAID